MNLLDMLFSTLGQKSSVNSLAKKSGGSESQIMKLITAGLPVLMKALTKNASSKEGAKSLSAALAQHTDTASISSQISNADSADGAKILKHILGGDLGSVLGSLSKETGMEEAQVESALDNMAPALMSELSAVSKAEQKKAKKAKEAGKGFDLSDGLDLGDVMSMFGGGSGAASGAGSLLTQLMGAASGGQKKSAVDGTDLLGSLMGLM